MLCHVWKTTYRLFIFVILSIGRKHVWSLPSTKAFELFGRFDCPARLLFYTRGARPIGNKIRGRATDFHSDSLLKTFKYAIYVLHFIVKTDKRYVCISRVLSLIKSRTRHFSTRTRVHTIFERINYFIYDAIMYTSLSVVYPKTDRGNEYSKRFHR